MKKSITNTIVLSAAAALLLFVCWLFQDFSHNIIKVGGTAILLLVLAGIAVVFLAAWDILGRK
jgi:hypothetical protein